MARCESMLAAFRAGGDFHSRTAMGMYAHVGEAVAKGSVLLEWDGKQARAAAVAAATQANGGSELDAAALAAIKVEPPQGLGRDARRVAGHGGAMVRVCTDRDGSPRQLLFT